MQVTQIDFQIMSRKLHFQPVVPFNSIFRDFSMKSFVWYFMVEDIFSMYFFMTINLLDIRNIMMLVCLMC